MPGRRAGSRRPVWILGAVGALVTVAIVAAVAAGGFSNWQDTDERAKERQPGTTESAPSTASTPASGTVELPDGSWVVIVQSLDQSEFSLAEAQAAAADKSGRLGETVEVVDSVGDAGLQDGYWALVVGPYSTVDDANAACSNLGLSLGSDCYPRQAGGS